MADQIPAFASNATINRPLPRGLDDTGAKVNLSGLDVKTHAIGGGYFKTVFTFTAFALTLTNTTGSTGHQGVKIYDFPRGKIHFKAAVSYLAFTTTSVLASTLNSGTSVQYGFGTVTSSATTLATTMINVLAGTGQTVPTFTSSSTINVASTAVTHHTLANPIPIDGSTTALDLYFNLAAASGLSATATLTVTGTLVIEWSNLGGWDFQNSAA